PRPCTLRTHDIPVTAVNNIPDPGVAAQRPWNVKCAPRQVPAMAPVAAMMAPCLRLPTHDVPPRTPLHRPAGLGCTRCVPAWRRPPRAGLRLAAVGLPRKRTPGTGLDPGALPARSRADPVRGMATPFL